MPKEDARMNSGGGGLGSDEIAEIIRAQQRKDTVAAKSQQKDFTTLQNRGVNLRTRKFTRPTKPIFDGISVSEIFPHISALTTQDDFIADLEADEVSVSSVQNLPTVPSVSEGPGLFSMLASFSRGSATRKSGEIKQRVGELPNKAKLQAEKLQTRPADFQQKSGSLVSSGGDTSNNKKSSSPWAKAPSTPDHSSTRGLFNVSNSASSAPHQSLGGIFGGLMQSEATKPQLLDEDDSFFAEMDRPTSISSMPLVKDDTKEQAAAKNNTINSSSQKVRERRAQRGNSMSNGDRRPHEPKQNVSHQNDTTATSESTNPSRAPHFDSVEDIMGWLPIATAGTTPQKATPSVLNQSEHSISSIAAKRRPLSKETLLAQEQARKQQELLQALIAQSAIDLEQLDEPDENVDVQGLESSQTEQKWRPAPVEETKLHERRIAGQFPDESSGEDEEALRPKTSKERRLEEVTRQQREQVRSAISEATDADDAIVSTKVLSRREQKELKKIKDDWHSVRKDVETTICEQEEEEGLDDHNISRPMSREMSKVEKEKFKQRQQVLAAICAAPNASDAFEPTTSKANEEKKPTKKRQSKGHSGDSIIKEVGRRSSSQRQKMEDGDMPPVPKSREVRRLEATMRKQQDELYSTISGESDAHAAVTESTSEMAGSSLNDILNLTGKVDDSLSKDVYSRRFIADTSGGTEDINNDESIGQRGIMLVRNTMPASTGSSECDEVPPLDPAMGTGDEQEWHSICPKNQHLPTSCNTYNDYRVDKKGQHEPQVALQNSEDRFDSSTHSGDSSMGASHLINNIIPSSSSGETRSVRESLPSMHKNMKGAPSTLSTNKSTTYKPFQESSKTAEKPQEKNKARSRSGSKSQSRKSRDRKGDANYEWHRVESQHSKPDQNAFPKKDKSKESKKRTSKSNATRKKETKEKRKNSTFSSRAPSETETYRAPEDTGGPSQQEKAEAPCHQRIDEDIEVQEMPDTVDSFIICSADPADMREAPGGRTGLIIERSMVPGEAPGHEQKISRPTDSDSTVGHNEKEDSRNNDLRSVSPFIGADTTSTVDVIGNSQLVARTLASSEEVVTEEDGEERVANKASMQALAPPTNSDDTAIDSDHLPLDPRPALNPFTNRPHQADPFTVRPRIQSDEASQEIADDMTTQSEDRHIVRQASRRTLLRKKLDDRRNALSTILHATKESTWTTENEIVVLKRKLATSQVLIQRLELENAGLEPRKTSEPQFSLLEQQENREQELEARIKDLMDERNFAMLECHELRILFMGSCETCRERFDNEKEYTMDHLVRNARLSIAEPRRSSTFQWITESLAEETKSVPTGLARSDARRTGDVKSLHVDTVLPDSSSIKHERSALFTEAPLNWLSEKFSSKAEDTEGEHEDVDLKMIDEVITYKQRRVGHHGENVSAAHEAKNEVEGETGIHEIAADIPSKPSHEKESINFDIRRDLSWEKRRGNQKRTLGGLLSERVQDEFLPITSAKDHKVSNASHSQAPRKKSFFSTLFGERVNEEHAFTRIDPTPVPNSQEAPILGEKRRADLKIGLGLKTEKVLDDLEILNCLKALPEPISNNSIDAEHNGIIANTNAPPRFGLGDEQFDGDEYDRHIFDSLAAATTSARKIDDSKRRNESRNDDANTFMKFRQEKIDEAHRDAHLLNLLDDGPTNKRHANPDQRNFRNQTVSQSGLSPLSKITSPFTAHEVSPRKRTSTNKGRRGSSAIEYLGRFSASGKSGGNTGGQLSVLPLTENEAKVSIAHNDHINSTHVHQSPILPNRISMDTEVEGERPWRNNSAMDKYIDESSHSSDINDIEQLEPTGGSEDLDQIAALLAIEGS